MALVATVAVVRVEIDRLEGGAADGRPELKLEPIRRDALAVIASAREAAWVRTRRVQVAAAVAGIVPPSALFTTRAVACLGGSEGRL